MTDQINDQISAFIDNELAADEAALLVRRFERDAEARSRAVRYTFIGAALRGELLEPHPSVLRQRVAAALSGAPVATYRAREPWHQRFTRPLAGVGIAATVAVAAIGLLRMSNPIAVNPNPGGGLAAHLPFALPPLQASSAIDAPSYVVPQEVPDGRPLSAPIRLTNYLMHHGAYASNFTRTSVNSNVVGAAATPTAEPALAESSTDSPAVAKPTRDSQ